MVNYLAGCSREVRKMLASVMVIVLCFMAVVGSTFALFTSDGKIGVNTTSGTVDVDLVDTAQNSLLDETLEFIVHKNGPAYFEPGATMHTQGFMVQNKGNVTINYRIYISYDPNENMGGFSDAFEIWISEDPNDLSDATKIHDFEGTLAPNETGSTYYLVVKMLEDADNDFQGQVYSGIGITVHAVQGNVDIDDVNNSDFE